MENLPSQKRASLPSLPEREQHREWIGGRALTLLNHYWREDDPVEMTAAIGRDWADVLEGIPQDYIQRACIQYQRDEPRRKPTPGAIYQIARSLMPRPVIVPPRDLSIPLRAPEREKTPEEAAEIEARMARKREVVARVTAEVAHGKRISGGSDA